MTLLLEYNPFKFQLNPSEVNMNCLLWGFLKIKVEQSFVQFLFYCLVLTEIANDIKTCYT